MSVAPCPTPPLYSAAQVLGRKADYSGTPYSGRTIARGPCRPAFLVDKQAPVASWRRAGDIGLSRPLAGAHQGQLFYFHECRQTSEKISHGQAGSRLGNPPCLAQPRRHTQNESM